MCVCVCVCVRACAHARARVCVFASVEFVSNKVGETCPFPPPPFDGGEVQVAKDILQACNKKMHTRMGLLLSSLWSGSAPEVISPVRKVIRHSQEVGGK